MKLLNVQEFINTHSSNWEEILSNKPFCLNITRQVWNNLNLVMFKYNQIESDFNEPIVRECRGLILNEDTLEIISYPFNKFGNVGEGIWVDNIDWNSAHVLEKCDGSIIKIVKVNGKLLISTNGCILASECNISNIIESSLKNFEDLFYWAIKEQFPNFKQDWFEQLFEEGYTYIFELCTNANKVVVPHPEPKVYFIGIRNNKTYKEVYIFDHDFSKIFPTPEIYPLKSLDECIAATQAMPWDEEGYVVVDKNFNRVKIKSPAYCAVHHLSPNGNLSIHRAIDLYMKNEQLEFLVYFPEYKSAFDEIDKRFKDKITELGFLVGELIANIVSGALPTRKDQAMWIISKTKHSAILFKILNEYVGDGATNCKKYIEKVKQVMIDLYHQNINSFVDLLGF